MSEGRKKGIKESSLARQRVDFAERRDFGYQVLRIKLI